MEKYNSLVPNGYNLREGGNSGRHHQSTKDKISRVLLDRNYKFLIGKDAAEKNNTTKAGISMVCNGKRIQLKGFKYKYEDDNITNILNELKKINI